MRNCARSSKAASASDRESRLTSNISALGNLCGPVFEVVIGRDARDQTVVDVEENSGRQHVFLTLGLRKTFSGRKIGAVYGELGRCASAALADHDRNVSQFLTVMLLHHTVEPAELLLADLAPALVDVVRNILRQASQHAFAVACIEGSDVALDQCNRFSFAHGYVPRS